MRILTGVVRAGSIELDDRGVSSALPDGTRVTVFVDEDADDDEDTASSMPHIPVQLAVRDEQVTLDEIPIQPLPDPAPEPTVLVVEDDPDLGEVFGEVIEAAGYK